MHTEFILLKNVHGTSRILVSTSDCKLEAFVEFLSTIHNLVLADGCDTSFMVRVSVCDDEPNFSFEHTFTLEEFCDTYTIYPF